MRPIEDVQTAAAYRVEIARNAEVESEQLNFWVVERAPQQAVVTDDLFGKDEAGSRISAGPTCSSIPAVRWWVCG